MRKLDFALIVMGGMLVWGDFARGQHDHEHAGDFVVGKDAGGTLGSEFAEGEVYPLPPVNGPLLFGCALDDPGFMSLEADEPDEGFFTLPPGAIIVFELVSIDPGLVIHTPGFADTLDTPGDTWVLGSAPFDEHPTWHIDANHPNYDFNATYSATFRLVDTSGECLTSEDITVTLGCAPPGACCLPDGTCEEGEFEDPCGDEGGTFLGADSVCAGSADGDAVDDVCDNCPMIANDDQADADGDGTGDACDGCPDDPAKTSVGQCGCGTPDTDSDGDSIADCVDGCPDDPNKDSPGACGCGVAETGDNDGDGVNDCVDQCPGVDDSVFAPGCAGAIPTMSQWGIICLALLLAVAGKIYFGRLPSLTAG